MRSLARFAGYAAVVGGLSLVLIYGAVWLASPDPSFKAEARAAPLSPRIAESIERKKDAIPRAEPVAVKPPEPMTEANVALTPPASKPILREAQPHKGKIKHASNLADAPRAIAPDAAAASPRAVVTTARSDVPY